MLPRSFIYKVEHINEQLPNIFLCNIWTKWWSNLGLPAHIRLFLSYVGKFRVPFKRLMNETDWLTIMVTQNLQKLPMIHELYWWHLQQTLRTHIYQMLFPDRLEVEHSAVKCLLPAPHSPGWSHNISVNELWLFILVVCLSNRLNPTRHWQPLLLFLILLLLLLLLVYGYAHLAHKIITWHVPRMQGCPSWFWLEESVSHLSGISLDHLNHKYGQICWQLLGGTCKFFAFTPSHYRIQEGMAVSQVLWYWPYMTCAVIIYQSINNLS